MLAVFLLSPFPLHAQDESSATTTPTQFFLTPAAPTGLRLHTHTADFRLGYDGNTLIGSVDALYRVQNSGETEQTLALKLIADGDNPPPDNLGLLVDDLPIAFTAVEDGALTAQVTVPADSTLDLRLSYAFSLGDAPISSLRYNPQPLRQWGSQPSVRVSIVIPEVIVSASWLLTSPPEWNFAPAEGQAPRIRWLFDEHLPEQPFLFQFIHPAQWQQVHEATTAAVASAPTTTFVGLGDLYQQLYTAATDGGLRDRFYAQALAAYTAGVESGTATGAPLDQLAQLHAGLAHLYRSRSVNAEGVVDPQYTGLMAREAALALAGLPADDARRSELNQWQVEGLTQQLDDARNRRDWATTAAVLEQLAALPPETVDPATLAETRRMLTVQQALELVEGGDTDAAMTLLGDQLTSQELLPPDNARALFLSWQVTMTISTEQTVVAFSALPAPDRQAAAEAALETLQQVWKNADGVNTDTIVLQPQATMENGSRALRLTVTFPARTSGANLAQATPPGADWALVRTLLAQLGPEVEQRAAGLHQQINLSQPLDVRSAGEQWGAVAATLEQQAIPLEAESAPLNLTDTNTLRTENALRARIKAANFRKAALEWRTLARNSLVVAQLVAGAGVQSVARTWLATPETPLQTLTLEASVMSLGRLLAAAVVAFAGLFVLAGVLWWML